jgi:hypothetical protein
MALTIRLAGVIDGARIRIVTRLLRADEHWPHDAGDENSSGREMAGAVHVIPPRSLIHSSNSTGLLRISSVEWIRSREPARRRKVA